MSEPAYVQNPDLSWDLDEFSQRERALDFVMQFQSTLCVYSPTVDMIYSTYEIVLPEEENAKLVILPDDSAFYDTFTHILNHAVTPTGLYVVPGELIGKTGLFLANVKEDRTLGKRQIPFEMGIRTIVANQPKDDPFLPVLTKGDLREFNQSWPVLHMHRVRPNTLEHLSQFDRTNLGNVIMEKLESLFVEQQKARVA